MASFSPSRLLIDARNRSGLTQRALARRSHTSQSVVARIESGAVSPTWKTLELLLRCAGFDLQATLNPRIRGRTHMLQEVQRILSLTPEQRLTELRNADRLFKTAVRVEP
jgi:predicted transcriptional regulator